MVDALHALISSDAVIAVNDIVSGLQIFERAEDFTVLDLGLLPGKTSVILGDLAPEAL